MNVCYGCQDERCKELWEKGVFKARGEVVSGSRTNSEVYRTFSCALLTDKTLQCPACSKEESNMIRQYNKFKKGKMKEKNFSKVNLRYMAKYELEAALRESRQETTRQKKKVQYLMNKIDDTIARKGILISKQWSDEFKNINQENFEKMSLIQKLFWDQQMKAASLKKATSMKWHPMMIRLALNLQMVSSSAYENVKKMGFVTLPSKRTLYDYSHAVEPKEGCQLQILEDLKRQLDSKCEEHERYVCLMCDEIHIRSNLVYQKSTGELIGYVKLDEVEQEFQNLQEEWTGLKPKKELAKSVVVFMIRNITASSPHKVVKGVVAMFSCSSLSPAGLYTRAWDVIFYLESSRIPVLIFTCDGASVNRAFINMHKPLGNEKYVHATCNIASGDRRPLFFVIDPHLVKTLRNNFANSGCHRKSRKLWNDGEEILWTLIMKYYEAHKSEKYRKCQITAAHVYLNSFSLMKVSYASQIMSKTLAAAIESDAAATTADGKNYPPHKEALKFMRYVNDFFDCLNGHNPTSHIRFKNVNLKPYSSYEDSRFEFLETEFLQFFDDWQNNVKLRPGRFTKDQRQRMFISQQTYTGLYVTVKSFIGAVKLLLSKGAKNICGRRICQDPLEQYFSSVRQKGGSSNNPDLQQVLQTRVTLHAQRQVGVPSARGNTTADKEELLLDSAPVPKRKKGKDE